MPTPVSFPSANGNVSLGQLVLAHLRATTSAQQWPTEDLDAIKLFLTTEQAVESIPGKDNPVEQALRRWIAQWPAEDALRVAQELPQTPRRFLCAMLPALLVWSCTQTWSRTTHLEESAALGLKLMKHLGDTSGLSHHHLLAYRAQAKMLRETLPDVKSPDQAWSIFAPWTLSSGSMVWEYYNWPPTEGACATFFDTWTYLGMGAEASDAVFENASSVGISLAARWKKRLCGALDHLPTRLHAPLCCTMLNHTVSPAIISAAFHELGENILGDNAVRAQMEQRLPATEEHRLPLLPWSRMENTFNQRMCQIYIPKLASLVDALAPASIWRDSSGCQALLHSMVHSQPDTAVLDVPHTLFEEPTFS